MYKLIDGLFAFELGCLAQEQGVILQYYGILSWVSNKGKDNYSKLGCLA